MPLGYLLDTPSRVIHVGIFHDKRVARETTLIKPEVQTLNQKGLAMVDAVVGFVVGGEVTLVIENHGTSPVQLPEGELLGSLHPTIMVDKLPQSVEEELGTKRKSNVQVAALQSSAVTNKERESQLLTALQLDDPEVTEDEHQQVTELVNEYADLFALSNTELGRTTIVQHDINTANHRPIKQTPHHVPFSL